MLLVLFLQQEKTTVFLPFALYKRKHGQLNKNCLHLVESRKRLNQDKSSYFWLIYFSLLNQLDFRVHYYY